ncbi:MAG: hypothetical protein K2Y37_13915 [Pirellulales bacterium]|nr:hypothetical protein [Pirellulales bacterium]
MRRKSLHLAILVLSLLFFPSYSFAANCSTNVYIFAASNTYGDTAHVLDMNPTNCSSACSGGRAYIDIDDKQLYAMALMAQAQGGLWRVDWVTGASSKGNSVLGNYTCKVVSISY